MARDFDSTVTEGLGRLRLDVAVPADLARGQGWLNDVIEDIHGRHDWFWACDRQVVQTVIDKTAGTVSVAASGTVVSGSGTAFASTDVGKFIQFQGSSDWYKVTAYSAADSITIEAGYTGTSALSGGTYVLRKMFYTLPGAEKLVSAKQPHSPRELVCINHKDFDTFLTFSDSTGKANLFAVYGADSTGLLQFTIHPHADVAYNLEVKYKKPAITGSLDIIPAKWRGVYLDGLLARGYEYIALGQPEFSKSLVQEKKADYERGIARMIADGEPESDYQPVLQNRDVPNAWPRNNLPDGLSIPQD